MSDEDEASREREAEIAQIVAATVAAMRPDGEEKDRSVTGRTPWDAATEVSSSLFGLLGQWTVYIVVIALLGVGWYFFEEQRESKDAAYNDLLAEVRAEGERKDDAYDKALAELRKERDDAYSRIASFNKDVAEISGRQISNLNAAFDNLQKIMEEAAKRRDEAFDNQMKAAEAADALIETESRLTTAEGNLAARKRELKTQTGELKEARAKLDKREREVKDKEADLNRRAGRIGELQDLVRELTDATDEELAARDRLLSETVDNILALSNRALTSESLETLSDDLTALSWDLRALSDVAASESYEAASARVRDLTVDPAALLRRVVDFEGWTRDQTALDGLIGVSVKRVEDAIVEGGGVGFDFWAVEHGGGESMLFGFSSAPTQRMRVVFLAIGAGPDGTDRIAASLVVDALLPAIGPDPSDAWSESVFIGLIAEDGSFDVDSQEWDGPHGAREIDLRALFKNKFDFQQVLVSSLETVPLMTAEDFNALARSEALPQPIAAALAEPDNELRVMFEMRAARDAGGPSTSRIVSVIEDADLRTATEAIFEAALRQDAARAATIAPELDNRMLGALAAVALQPGFKLDSSVGAKFIEPGRATRAPIQSQLSSPDRLDLETWTQQATVTASSDATPPIELGFWRTAMDPKWRVDACKYSVCP